MAWFAALTLLMGLIMGAAVYGICRWMEIPMPWEVKLFPSDDDDLGPAVRDYKPVLRKCGGCGVIYHVSWGRFCPDCTGAD